ncbi:hypothetical protein J3U50_00090 [Lactobacillus sp. B3795]|uniref:hypothetical protein n=1 Tax=Lactobacillaceae TaxID=33958 RepID=UPI00265D0BDE|nr:hypothetical protein [Lactobacillus sp. B3795]MCX8742418.1 hypothetical protein [Lactobacillus sp. B3795]
MDNGSDNQQPDFQQQNGQPNGGNQSIYINQAKTNGIGTAGFVLSLIALLVTSWIPFVDFVVWLLGAIFSIIGLFKQPKGLAIAGTIISFIGIIFILFVVSILFGAALA